MTLEKLLGEISRLKSSKVREIVDRQIREFKEVGLSLAKLDLYLWYLKTGEILK